MRRIIVFILFLCSVALYSQDEYIVNDFEKHREVGFNVSELINIFIPFKGRVASGPFGAVWRSGRNNKYLNIQLGARVLNTNNDNDDFFNLQIGYLKKIPINEKFLYYRSINGFVSAGGFNVPGIPNDRNDGTSGVSFGLGFEYTIVKNISVGTEALLVAGIVDSGTFQIIPPVGIFLMGRF